jgi:ferredoxin--NADP+ reductase
LNTYRVAIVGAGPAGYFAAQALFNAQSTDRTFLIDMIERLPTPWGLVRSGVAPDHQKIKTVSKVFEKIAKQDNFRLFANTELGKDISLKDLSEVYDAVILATGASSGKKLGIKGEELQNSFSAAEFVSWYNAHPDFTNLKVNLDTDAAIIIGNGNVAIDIARMLLIDPEKLEPTDIAQHALPIFKSSKIKKVIICGRRTPENAAFTSMEFRNLIKLENFEISVDDNQLKESILRISKVEDLDREVKNNLHAMSMVLNQSSKSSKRKLEIMFLVTPLEFKGINHVEEVVFAINKVNNGKVETTNEIFSLKAQLVISAIGYEPIEYQGIKIKNGRIENIAGHVKDNIFVVGWAKRGSVGVIGTNKSDATDVVDLLLKVLKVPKKTTGIEGVLQSNHKFINQIGWEKINASEVISGELSGKPRIKESDWNSLINLGTT